MSRRISILGSTGSIGRQSLEVIAACGMTVGALTANSNVARMEEQVRQFQPELAVMMDEKAAADLKVRLADTKTRVASGMEGLVEAAELPSADTVITAVVGMIGLRPTMAAIREGKRIALANKETLVCAGQLVQEEARDWGAEILPVDSEHSALFQSLQGCKDRREVKRLILTCSGGPFFGKEPGGAGTYDKGRCITASKLEHGGQNHRGLGHPDEQGAGIHRGHAPLPHASGENFHCDPPGEYHSLSGGIL